MEGAALALDLARTFGWACGVKASRPVIGSVRLEGRDRPAVYAGLLDWLDDARAVHAFTRVVAEAPMVTGDFRGRDAALMAIGLGEFVGWWCWENSIPFEQVHVGTARKAVLGRGNFAAGSAKSVVSELVFSSITAPIFLMYQTRSVLQVLRGADGGWPAQTRGDGTLSLADAWAASHWIVTAGAAGLGLAQWLSPALVPWLLPVALPMVIAPLLISWSSRPSRTATFTTPTERQSAAVMHLQHLILDRWQGMEAPDEPDLPDPAVTHA